MGHLEHKRINQLPIKPLIWYRCIDDIFCILPAGLDEAKNMVHFLNHQHPTIKFTADMSTTMVYFLDVTVIRQPDKSLHTTLFWKPTDTYRYLHFKSFHPTAQKKSIPSSQYLRVRRMCTSKTDFFKFTNIMLSHLASRGYHMSLLIDS